uniref:Lipid droplet-associated hydrolase n=1 Tax=Strigamia maritima TaxID=126957 RepID=T1JCR1_STRMM
MDLKKNHRHDGYITINEVPTHIITYGGWLDTLQDVKEKKIVILVIPEIRINVTFENARKMYFSGNPGMIEYYQLFMETIFERLDRKHSVIGISHAGHVRVPDNYRIPKLSENEHLYSVSGQLKHKLLFIEDYLPDNISLILIGHSIGSYISLHLMNLLPKQRVLKAILLFPTIERLAESPNGRWAWPTLTYFRPIILILVYFLSYLSTPMQYNLLEFYFRHVSNVTQGNRWSIPACTFAASLNVLDVHCTNKWMYMAKTEMESVNELNVELIKSNLSKLIFYYGSTDRWCPVSYYEKVKELFPLADIKLCDKNIDHAFVLQSSAEVAKMVVKWIEMSIIRIY